MNYPAGLVDPSVLALVAEPAADSIALSWTANGSLKYRVYIGLSPNSMRFYGETEGLTFDIANLIPARQYFVQVTGYNGPESTVGSAVLPIIPSTPSPPPPPPPSPNVLALTYAIDPYGGVDTSAIALDWSAPQNIVNFTAGTVVGQVGLGYVGGLYCYTAPVTVPSGGGHASALPPLNTSITLTVNFDAGATSAYPQFVSMLQADGTTSTFNTKFGAPTYANPVYPLTLVFTVTSDGAGHVTFVEVS